MYFISKGEVSVLVAQGKPRTHSTFVALTMQSACSRIPVLLRSKDVEDAIQLPMRPEVDTCAPVAVR